MSRSKIDFILEILENKNLNQQEKEKFLSLSSKELKNISQAHKEIRSEIEQIKRAISKHFNIRQPHNKESSSSTKTDKKKDIKHRPKDVADFMSMFDQRDKFKYLTHPFDQDRPFRVQKFLNHAESVFLEKTNVLDIPQSLFSLIKNFAFETNLGERNEEGYLICWRNFDNRAVTEGWSKSPNIERLVEKQDQNSIQPFEVEEFKKIIDQFRKVTRIKASQNDPQLLKYLKQIVNSVFAAEESDFDINFDSENLKKADFYCHVRRLVMALEIILKEFKDAKKPRINISFERTYDDNYRVAKLILSQLESFPSKDLADIKEEWFGTKGSMGGIRENIYGYCNWSVETRVKDGNREKDVCINILGDDGMPLIGEPSSEIVGFKHILIFYK